jgi:hypothetical protein
VGKALFWGGAGSALWVLAGYPLALRLAKPRSWATGTRHPGVSIVVPAYCELEELPPKLKALAGLRYPPDQVEVIVVVGGNEALADAAEAACPRATVIREAERSGKAAALNLGIARAKGEVVLLTDANNLISTDALGALVRHFADEEVWAVVGRRAEAGSLYDRYEDLIRRLETRSGSVAAGSGELLAVRRARLEPLPPGVINDDLWIVTDFVGRGGRVVYEPGAVSTEPALPGAAELERRTRISAGRALLLRQILGLPSGFRWRMASHKLGRLLLPFSLLAMLAGPLGLLGDRRWRLVLLVQSALCGLAAAAVLDRDGVAGRSAAGRAARQFAVGNAASAQGVVRAARGAQDARWEAVR